MSTINGPDSSTLGNILWNWVSNSTASKSDDLATQITCYTFPYGGAGFVAHLVMFYGIVLSSLNKCPWNPRKPLSRPGLDLIFGIAGFVISGVFMVVTIIRCSGAKQYIFIAVSKILASVTSTAIGIHIAWNIRGRKKDGNDGTEIKLTHYKTLGWFVVHLIGSILELIGVIMILKESRDAVHQNKQSVLIISFIFAGFMGILFGIGIVWLEMRQRTQRRVEWELHTIQTKCTALEEGLAAQRPRLRAPSRRQSTANGSDEVEEPQNPDDREDRPRRSGQPELVDNARRDPPSPVGRERDIEGQGLIEGQAADQPVLYHYQDVLNSVWQIVMVAGAAFIFSVTLYTDWILAAVSDSYLGFPTAGNVPLTAVYVIFYFVVRLMPALSA